VQQDGVSSPSGFGFVNSLKITNVTGGAAAAGDNLSVYQAIEGSNISDLAWGTSVAQPVTLSFYVLCSVTGTFGVAFRNSAANRSYVASYTVSAANTWQLVTVTIPGDTSGTWLTTNGVGIYVSFALGVGSTFQTSAGSWQAGNVFAVTGQVNLCTTSGAVFQYTGVQLEKGSVATPFEFRSIGTELGLCQRYYALDDFGTTQYGRDVAASRPSTVGVYFPVSMRTSPTVTVNTSGGVGPQNTTISSRTLVISATASLGDMAALRSYTASAEL
jgi:hypothetical protein